MLVVDEAHHLRNDVLEDLRLLTNYAMDSEPRLCLLLVGLSELRRRMAVAVHESLTQRIIVRLHLTGLARNELADFHGDNTCTCPAGCTLRSSGALYKVGLYLRQDFKASASDCTGCAQRAKCIRKPDATRRTVALHTQMPDDPQDPLHRMR